MLAEEDFDYLATLLSDRIGLFIDGRKTYLIESRLTPIAVKHGLTDVPNLIRAMRDHGDPALVDEVLDAMTTNESLFFRDAKVFDSIRGSVLPRLMAARAETKRLRIWSAACSTGQEPYTLAIILAEMGERLDGWSVELVATDISPTALKRARSGRFSQFEVQRGLPVNFLVKYFTQSGTHWEVVDPLKKMVRFEAFNLLDDPARLGTFDLIMCRNVLIYFEPTTKTRIIEAMAGRMPDHGLMVLGAAESMFTMSTRFEAAGDDLARGIYRLKGDA